MSKPQIILEFNLIVIVPVYPNLILFSPNPWKSTKELEFNSDKKTQHAYLNE